MLVQGQELNAYFTYQVIPTPGTFVDQGLLFFGAPFWTQIEHLPSRPVVSGPAPFGFEESNTLISEFSRF